MAWRPSGDKPLPKRMELILPNLDKDIGLLGPNGLMQTNQEMPADGTQVRVPLSMLYPK